MTQLLETLKKRFIGRLDVELRMAKPEDLTVIECLYADFTGEHMRIAVLDKAIVKESIKRMICDQALMLATVKDQPIGFIAGYFQNCHFSNDVMFSMMYFFLQEDYRQHSAGLLKVVEELLKKNTVATKFVVSSPAFEGSDKLDRWYKMQGFSTLETHFYRDIIRIENLELTDRSNHMRIHAEERRGNAN